MMPRLISGWPSLARSPMMRMWQAMASSIPPPSAMPLIAAMKGLTLVAILEKVRWPWLISSLASAAVVTLVNSLMSAPATKASCPPPVITATFTFGSALISSTTDSSSSKVCTLRALTGGWSIVMIAMRSSSESFTNCRSAMSVSVRC
jgi:hypothetical protein